MNIIGPMIQFVQQLRIFHWQTESYAQHKAFGKAYDEVDELVDTFVETYMGKFGRAKPTVTYQIALKSLNSSTVVNEVLDGFIAYLGEMNDHPEISSDLLNIRDSILGEVNHLKYLLSLR